MKQCVNTNLFSPIKTLFYSLVITFQTERTELRLRGEIYREFVCRAPAKRAYFLLFLNQNLLWGFKKTRLIVKERSQ